MNTVDNLLSNDPNQNVSKICRTFYANLKRFGKLDIEDNARRFRIVHRHVYKIVEAEELEPVRISFVHSSQNASLLCSDLITAALMDMKPAKGVCFCTRDTGVLLSSYASRLKNSPSSRQSFLENLRRSFTVNVTGDFTPIQTVFVPLNLKNLHWGVLIGKIFIGSERAPRVKPTVYFGDILGWKCPENVLNLFKEAFQFSVLQGSGDNDVTISKRNYMLEIREFSRQTDGHSCGCYVIATATEIASEPGFAPRKTYRKGYSPHLSELYRWMAIRSRVLQVLLASQFFETDQVTEPMVSNYRLNYREAYFTYRGETKSRLKKMEEHILRRSDFKIQSRKEVLLDMKSVEPNGKCGNPSKRPLSSTPGIPSRESDTKNLYEMATPTSICVEMNQKDEQKEKVSPSYDDALVVLDDVSDDDDDFESDVTIDKNAIRKEIRRVHLRAKIDHLNDHLTPVLPSTSKRRLKFLDSILAATSVLDSLIQDVVQNSNIRNSASSKHVKTTLMKTSSFRILKEEKGSKRNHFTGEVSDILSLMTSLAKLEGYLYGLLYFRYLQFPKKGSFRIVNVRMRCMRHSHFADSCPSNVIGYLTNLDAKWKVSLNLNHSHEPFELNNEEIANRCNVLKTKMQNRFLTWRKKYPGKSTSYWDTLYSVCFPSDNSARTNERERAVEEVDAEVQNTIRSAYAPLSVKNVKVTPTTPSILRKKPVTITPSPVLGSRALNVPTVCSKPISAVVDEGESGTDKKGDVGDVEKEERNDIADVCWSSRDSSSFGHMSNTSVARGLALSSSELDSLHPALSEKEGKISNMHPRDIENGRAAELIEQLLFLVDAENVPTDLLHITEDVSGNVSDIEKETEKGFECDALADKKGGSPENDVDDFFKAAVIAYFGSLPLDAPGRKVIKEIRFIAETMGYSLKCRTSIFLGEREADLGSGMVEDNRVLKKSILKCRKKDDIELCGFSLTVKALISDKEGEGKLYVGDFQEARHNHHPSTNRAGIRHLPPKMRREALHMTNSLHFSLPDTIRYLQDKYEIVINPNSVRKMIGYGRSISNPRDLECTKLFKELVSLHEENVENRYYVTHDSEGRMVSARWAFSEWIEDYKTFGVVPGVSVDCKAVANRYGFPLITINGRSNDGFVLTFLWGL